MMLRDYFNIHAHHWDETSTEKDTSKLDALAKRLGLKPGDRVLDIGTGTGVFLPYVLNEIGLIGNIIALDIAEKMLSKASQKSFGDRVSFICGDVTEIPLESGICNAAVCYSSFAHFSDKHKALLEMKRVLIPGGCLLICHTSNRHTINEIHSGIPEACHDLLPRPEQMSGLLSNAGFTDLQVEDSPDGYFVRARKSG